MDVMFVNGKPYLTSISRALYYRMATPLPGRKTEELLNSLDQVLRLYNSNGFYIATVYCDNEFKKVYPNLQDNYDGVALDFSKPKAHVPEAERNNRVIKERIRATYHRLPYNCVPSQASYANIGYGECSQSELFPCQAQYFPALQSETNYASNHVGLCQALSLCFGPICPSPRRQ